MTRRVWIMVLNLILWCSFPTCFCQESANIFPLGRSMAGERELPLTFGIGLTFYNQVQDYDIEHLEVDLPLFTPEIVASADVSNTIDELNLTFDLWVLPFLNVFALVGTIDGMTLVDLETMPGFSVDYSGNVYGGGFTLAAGGEHLYGSLSTTYTSTDLNRANSKVEAWYVVPRLGYRLKGGSFWVGATYQNADETHAGFLELPFYGPVNYDVSLHESNSINGMFGVNAQLGKHWDLLMEAGLGDRTHVLATLTRRF